MSNEILLIETNKQVYFEKDYIENNLGWVDTFISRFSFVRHSVFSTATPGKVTSIYDLHLITKKPYEEYKDYFAKNIRYYRNK